MFSGKTSLNIIYPNMSMILPQLGPHLISSSSPNVIPTIMDVGGTKLERMRWDLSSFLFLLLSVSIIMRGWYWTFLYQKCQKNKECDLRYEFSLMETNEDDGAGNRIQLEHDIVFNNVKVWTKSINLVVGHFNTSMCMTSICFSRRTLTKVRAIS